MIKILMVLTCICISMHATASNLIDYTMPNVKVNNTQCAQIGRYQITANDKDLYLLETDTGRIWVARKWEAKDISVMYPNGWKQLKIDLPTNIMDRE